MLHRRSTKNRLRLLIALLAVLFFGQWQSVLADEKFRCTHCHLIRNKGFEINGKFYCTEHADEALPKCHNCREPIRGSYVAVGHQHRPICLSCRHNLPRCFLCTLPAGYDSGGAELYDGRTTCREHSHNGVTEQKEAQRIFRQATAEVKASFPGKLELKNPIKDVKLVGRDAMSSISHRNGHSSGSSEGRVLGVTTVTFVSRGHKQWLEPATIHLLDHVPARRMLAVAAHEYAHVWHAENHRDYTQSRPIIREGFAEWVAYKVTQDQGRKDILEKIKNPAGGVYYRGLLKFLELEKRRGVQGVLEFAKQANDF